MLLHRLACDGARATVVALAAGHHVKLLLNIGWLQRMLVVLHGRHCCLLGQRNARGIDQDVTLTCACTAAAAAAVQLRLVNGKNVLLLLLCAHGVCSL